jgi:hypothetical protein
MKLTTLIVFLFFYLCTSCTRYDADEPLYVQLAHQITEKTAKKLKKEKNLIPVGSGGGMMDDVKAMMLAFNYYNEVSIEEARKLLIDCVEEFLAAVNSNEQIRPFLHNYPFTAENIEIAIYFSTKSGAPVSSNNICVASSWNGNISYRIDISKTGPLTTIREETYQEALQLASAKQIQPSQAIPKR